MYVGFAHLDSLHAILMACGAVNPFEIIHCEEFHIDIPYMKKNIREIFIFIHCRVIEDTLTIGYSG